MHAVLFFFLWTGINWQTDHSEVVEAEVWDMTTQQAAPPPPPEPEPEPTPAPAPEPTPAPPPPPPPVVVPEKVAPPKVDPEIALKRERERKKEEQAKIAAEQEAKLKKKQEEDERKLAEQKKKEADKKKREEEEREQERERLADEKAAEKKKADDDKKKQLAAQKAAEKKSAERQAKLRAEEMQRITGSATGSTGTAEKSTAPRMDSGYRAAIAAKIKSNISYAGSQDVPGNPSAEFKITQLPTGEIISVRKTKSSGIPAYDAAVENAISKSSPLPKKKDGTVERDITAAFNLKDLP